MFFQLDLPTLSGAGALWFTNIFDFGIRASLIFSAAWLITSFMRRSGPAARHRVWALSFLLVALLPIVAGYIAPFIRIPLITAFWNILVGPAELTAIGQMSADGQLLVLLKSWPAVFLIAWVGAGCFFLLRHLLGFCAANWIARSSQLHFNQTIQELFNTVRQELGIRRAVKLVRSGSINVPMTTGSLTPFVALPAEAEYWPLQRLRAVFVHELAHVKRWDYLTKLLSIIAKSFFWFSPLVWIAQHKMNDEMERACDELVLESGVKPSEYALGLAILARRARGTVSLAASMPMGADSSATTLMKRLKAILDPGTTRKKPRRYVVAAAACCVLIVSLPAFVFQPFHYSIPCNLEELEHTKVLAPETCSGEKDISTPQA